MKLLIKALIVYATNVIKKIKIWAIGQNETRQRYTCIYIYISLKEYQITYIDKIREKSCGNGEDECYFYCNT